MREPVMQGRGFYNSHSELQARSAEASDAVLQRALEALALPASGPLTIADYGASQGHNSMRQIGLALDAIARRAPARDVIVLHTDLPGSDFSALFATLEQAPESYRRGRPHAFPAAVGHSFYDRLLPAGSLSFGWSAFAVHWMSALPGPVSLHVWPVRARGREAVALAERGAEDWRGFLRHRAEELVAGGRLVLVVGAVNESGETGLEPMMDAANDVLDALVREGVLEAEAYAAMTIPARPRRREELTRPFDHGELPGLELEELVIASTPNAAMLRWEETGDAGRFATDLAGFFAAAFGPSLFGEDERLRERFLTRFAAAVAAAPERIARPLVTATLRIARI